jgi:hypothetical protein
MYVPSYIISILILVQIRHRGSTQFRYEFKEHMSKLVDAHYLIAQTASPNGGPMPRGAAHDKITDQNIDVLIGFVRDIKCVSNTFALGDPLPDERTQLNIHSKL